MFERLVKLKFGALNVAWVSSMGIKTELLTPNVTCTYSAQAHTYTVWSGHKTTTILALTPYPLWHKKLIICRHSLVTSGLGHETITAASEPREWVHDEILLMWGFAQGHSTPY